MDNKIILHNECIDIKEIIVMQIKQLAKYNETILEKEPEQYRKNLETMCDALDVIKN